MRDLECAAALLAAAERDRLTVQSMSDAAPLESVGFHLQQAAEKALKAWLAALGETYPLTQNLATLRNMLADRGMATAAFEGLTDLTPYAVEFRYEGAGDDASSLDMDALRASVDALGRRSPTNYRRGAGRLTDRRRPRPRTTHLASPKAPVAKPGSR